jgi:lipoate-protein ligase B
VTTLSETLTVVRRGVVDYTQAWDEQKKLHAALVDGTGRDTLLLLEHPSVYTAGRRTEASTSTAAARSPGTGRGSWSATRSSGCRSRWTSWPTCAASSST